MAAAIEELINTLTTPPTKASKSNYLDRHGGKITREEWLKLREDPDYCTLGQFQNEKVLVRAVWHGYPRDHRVMEEYWEIFQLEIYNRLENKWVIDPGSRFYWDEQQMMAAYRVFLKRYTDCHDDDEGNFVEVGNELAPPDPNKASGAEENTFIGSW